MPQLTINGDRGSLPAYPGDGMLLRIPCWIAFVLATPLTAIGILGLALAPSIVTVALAGFAAVPFLFAFRCRSFARRAPLQILRSDRVVFVLDVRGRVHEIKAGEFVSIDLELVRGANLSAWRAVLRGTERNVVLASGASSQRKLADWIQPVSAWLHVPVVQTERVIDGVAWVINAGDAPHSDPYAGQQPV
jgi:hypothetical protein